ncbi:SET domain-containing protein [Pseudomarimonas arenosa]|uniref:SET domain-containing protein-lysine N-methyltransferase n=1 Tax=Pseudomarimonas arenosa TaxID=2774145 RepID=A0AAW3ZL76_9GAMM|nr:SET domain-containing protein-lysine N-methyltransferase [Pseudomarimonas arenosa]MBD8526493.1 SET domain-containing protein-lysine N-methyltransferase [Pseudomarimonas arenosa]
MKRPPKLITRCSPIHGNGVFAGRDLKAGKELIEYKGKRISHKKADKRYANTSDTGHTFLFTLNEKYIIDANEDGNDARWINHSCDPNCQAVLHEAEDGKAKHDKVIIETLRPIVAGEELTYDYGIVLEEKHTKKMKKIWACRCGSPKCSGTMLKPKRKSVAE